MTRLSNRQYPMLKALHDNHRLSIVEAQTFDQRPFRSMLIRKYCAYTGHGFKITPAGVDALYEFENTEIARKNPQLPLTAYFDYQAYGLTPPTKARKGSVREFISKGHAA